MRADILTYTWLLEGMFGVIWASWVWEFAESVRSGDFAVELLRPGDPYLRLAAFDLGRSLNVLATRLVAWAGRAAGIAWTPSHLAAGDGRARGRRPHPRGARHRGHRPPHLPRRGRALTLGAVGIALYTAAV